MAIFIIPWAKPDAEVRALVPGRRDTANMTNAGTITITQVAGRTYDHDAPWGSVTTSWSFSDGTSYTTSSDKLRKTYGAAGTFTSTATTGTQYATGTVSPTVEEEPSEEEQPPEPEPESVPDEGWLKADIVDWLLAAGVDFTESALTHMTKVELLALVVDLTDAEE